MITIDAISEAQERIRPHVRRTPLVCSAFLSDLAGADVHLKLESEQTLRSFKLRGMVNRVLTMTAAERARGIVVASSGNHGAAASYVGWRWGISVDVWVPATTPAPKVSKIRRYGARLHLVGDNYDEAAAAAHQALVSGGAGRGVGADDRRTDRAGAGTGTGAEAQTETAGVAGIWIDSSADETVVTGHGSIGIEVLEDLPGADAVLIPVGGGGLLTGIAVAVKALRPGIEVVGVQTAACPAMVASLRDGMCYEQYPTGPSVCEALVGGIGKLAFDYAPAYVDRVVEVSEAAISRAVLQLIDHDQVLAEPSGAVGAAYLMENPDAFRGRTVAVVVSGGNISLDGLRRLMAQHT